MITQDRDLLKNLSQILFFESWNRLNESIDYKGFYLNQAVEEINRDSVIFLPDMVLTGLEGPREPFIVLTGVGLYYTQFSLMDQPGKIITDQRELTGIMLPLDTYDRARDITGSVINSPNLLMTEFMASIPFSLIFARQTTQMFIRGVISRNIMHPHKECFDQLVQLCQNPTSLQLDEGFKLLAGRFPSITTHAGILTEQNIEGYSQPTAGLSIITPTVQPILEDLHIYKDETKSSLFDKFDLIKKDFIEIGYPQLQDWMP